MRKLIIKTLKTICFSLATIIISTGCEKETENYIYEESSTISTDGGTFSVTDPDSPVFGFSVKFPSGAINKDTEINLRVLEDPANLEFDRMDQFSEVVDISTSAESIFNKPVEITFPLNINLKDKLFITYALYNNSSEKDWHGLEIVATDTINNSITFRTSHFSKFLIGGYDLGNESLLVDEVLDTIKYAVTYIDKQWCELLNVARGILGQRLSNSMQHIQMMTYSLNTCDNPSLCGSRTVFLWLLQKFDEKLKNIKLDGGIKMLRTISSSEGRKLDPDLLSILQSPCLLCALKQDNTGILLIWYIIESWYTQSSVNIIKEINANDFCNRDLKIWKFIDFPTGVVRVYGMTHIPGDYSKRYITYLNKCYILNWDFTSTGNSFICSQIPVSDVIEYRAHGIAADENYFYVVAGSSQVERYKHTGEFVNVLIDQTHLYWAGFSKPGYPGSGNYGVCDLTVAGNELIITGGPVYTQSNIARFNKNTGELIAKWEEVPLYPYGICWLPSITTDTFSCDAPEGCVIVSQFATDTSSGGQYGNGPLHVFSPDGSIYYGELPTTGYYRQLALDCAIYDIHGTLHKMVLYHTFESNNWLATLTFD